MCHPFWSLSAIPHAYRTGDDFGGAGGHPCPTGMGLSQRPFCVCPAGYVAGHRRRDQLLLSAGFWGDARPAVTAVAVMGLNVTIVCMMNFVDAWALRLISEGYGSITAPPAPVGRCPLRWGYGLWLGSRPVGLSSGKCDFMGTVHTAGNRDPAPAQSGARVSFLRRLFYSTSS